MYLTELAVQRSKMPPKHSVSGETGNMSNIIKHLIKHEKKVSNDVLYWYLYHFHSTGIGTSNLNFLNDT